MVLLRRFTAPEASEAARVEQKVRAFDPAVAARRCSERWRRRHWRQACRPPKLGTSEAARSKIERAMSYIPASLSDSSMPRASAPPPSAWRAVTAEGAAPIPETLGQGVRGNEGPLGQPLGLWDTPGSGGPAFLDVRGGPPRCSLHACCCFSSTACVRSAGEATQHQRPLRVDCAHARAETGDASEP